jgi:hypothetical protein
MAETERTLHDELEEVAGEAVNAGESVVDALLPLVERHFRARLLSDESRRRAAQPLYVQHGMNRELAWVAAYDALSAALDHVSGPEGGESRG